MTSSESARLTLYARLEEVLGPDNAETLMMSLPTQGANSLATKADISRLEVRFDRLEDRFDRQGERFDQHLRTYMVATVGAMTGLTGIFAVVVSLVN